MLTLALLVGQKGSDAPMSDLTPEERERIYLEEKARREASLDREWQDDPKASAQREEQLRLQREADEAQAKKEAALRAARAEKESQARFAAAEAFKRIEKEAEAKRNTQLWLDRKKRKEQEKLRLEKWQNSKQRNVENIVIVVLSILFLLNLKIWALTAPVLVIIILCKLLKVRKGWAIYTGVVVFGLLLINHYLSGQISETVDDDLPYQVKIARELELAKQLKLTPEQHIYMIKINLQQIDLKSSDIVLQKALLAHAKSEFEQVIPMVGLNKETEALALKIATIDEALSQKEIETKRKG